MYTSTLKKAAVLLIAVLLFGCNKWDNNKSFATAPFITKSFTSGKWYLSTGDKKNETAYMNYEFLFNADNSVLIHNGKHNYHGKWLVINDDGTDDSPASDIGFKLVFTSCTPKLVLLNHTYNIVKRTKNELQLTNMDVLDTKKITFKKAI